MRALRLIAFPVVLLLAACVEPAADAELPYLGDFRLGHDVVVAKNAVMGPLSREATGPELSKAVADAVNGRLWAYDGDGLYHLGIAVGAYVLAQPGIPVVLNPKSVMVVDVTIFDNATGEQLTEEPFRINAFEGLENSVPLLGSGHARGRQAQLANLANDVARQVHAWLIENGDWFTPDPDAMRTPFDRAAELAKVEALR